MIRKLTQSPLYATWLVLIGIVITWTSVTNLLLDPHFHSFLLHKTNLITGQHVNFTLWPWVVRIHILFASTALVFGFMNFYKKRLPQLSRLHRSIGYVYMVSVYGIVLTSGYLAPFATGGRLVSVEFNLINILSLYTTSMALHQIRKHHVANHRKWLVRSYVLCYLNPFIHLYLFCLYTVCRIDYILSYSIAVYSSAMTCICIGEVVVRKFSTIIHTKQPIPVRTVDNEIPLDNFQ